MWPSPAAPRTPKRLQTVREIEALGRRALAVECDVRSEASVRAAVAAATADSAGSTCSSTTPPSLSRQPLETSPLSSGTPSLRPTPADRFWWRARRCPICAPRRPHRQHRLARRHPRLGRPRPLLRLKGRPAHAHPGHGQGLRARGERQLRRSRLDRIRSDEPQRRASRPRAFAARTPMGRNGSRGRRRRRPCSSSPPDPHFITGQILAVDGGLGL